MIERVALIFTLTLSAWQHLDAQDRNQSLNAVFDVARAARYATFTTVGADGHARDAAVLQPQRE